MTAATKFLLFRMALAWSIFIVILIVGEVILGAVFGNHPGFHDLAALAIALLPAWYYWRRTSPGP